MKIVISRQELAAALIFASTDKSRYLITGVLVEVRPGKRPLLVATDGRRLVAIDTVAEQYDHFTEEANLVLVPEWAELFVKLAKAVGTKLFPWVCLEVDADRKAVSVTVMGREETELRVARGVLMEGDYPNWRKTVPSKRAQREAVTDVGLNSELVGDFAKAAKLLECPDNVIQMNLVGKEKAIEIKMPRKPNFYGLLMQCRLEDIDDYQPDFLGIMEELEKAPEPAKLAEPPPDEELVRQATDVVREEGRASVSLIQRRLRLGYARAFQLVEQLEKLEIVGPAKGNGEPREVYGI